MVGEGARCGRPDRGVRRRTIPLVHRTASRAGRRVGHDGGSCYKRGMPLTLPVEPRKIFIRGPNWVGDMVMATASLDRIRSGFPDAEIVLGVRPYLLPLLEGSPAFDRIVPTPKGGLKTLLSLVRFLRKERFDLAITMPNSLATGLAPFLARVPFRLGYQQGRPGLMNMGLKAQPGRSLFRRHGPRRIPKPMPLYYHELLDVLALPPGGLRGSLAISGGLAGRLAHWLEQMGIQPSERLVLLNAGASFGGSKFWQADRFAAVASHFASRGFRPLLLAGPAEVAMVEDIARRASVLAATRPVLPLDMLKALVARAALLITTDSGPRHVAVAFDRPVVCLMGPNDPRYTDYCMDKTVLIRKDIPCSPCQLKTCPLGHHDCMKLITVEEVIAAGERLLAGNYPAAEGVPS